MAPKGLVFNIQKYSIHDGPGIRTTVFLKGCPLCCAWCHNPEGISPRREFIWAEQRCVGCGECREACEFGETIAGLGPLPVRPDPCTECGACADACPTGARQWVGRGWTVAEVVAEVIKDRIFYDDSGGGVTVSGGEPLQQPRFLLALLEGFRAVGVRTALDTTGYGCTEHLLAAARLSDLVLYDLKAFSEERHRVLTGVSNRGILENLVALDDLGRDVWIRIPIVPGYTDDPGEWRNLAECVARLACVRQVNLLPFHRSGLDKYRRLGGGAGLDGVESPAARVMEEAAGVFRSLGLETVVGG